MSDEQPPEILGRLPNKRPQRRSEKRSGAQSSNGGAGGEIKQAATGSAKRPASAKPKPTATGSAKRSPTSGGKRTEPLRQPRQPGGTPPKPDSRRPAPPSGPEIVSTMVQAAVELAEIGLSATARSVRDALSRLPRP